ncbi:MAG: hypothetical protein COA32_08020 [Fluviicola sp.]|nr:MAG: hypothetical protein COA32_08020 [Fluviicola sp.]
MKKFIQITLSFALITNFGFSQELLPVEYDTTNTSARILINGNAFHFSTAIQNSFARKWLFGGEITDEIKESTFSEHNLYDRIGGGYRLNIQYRSDKVLFKKRSDLSWMLNVSNETHFSSEYAQGLFGLLFFGNERFLGEEANLSNSVGSFVDYITIGGGIHNKKTKSFITLNVVLPRAYSDFYINRGSFFTSESGDKIDILLEGELNRTASPAYFQGLGGAISFDYNFPFGQSEGNNFSGTFRVSGRNIGVYKLNSVDRISIDADAEFSGFSIEDLRATFNNENESSSPITDSLNITEGNNSFWKFIPGFIQIGKVVDKHSDTKFQSFFGIRMYTSFLYRPLIFAGVDYKPIENFSLGAQGTYGGYGLFRLGMYGSYSAEKFSLGLGSEDLLGLIMKNQYGQSLVLRLLLNI